MRDKRNQESHEGARVSLSGGCDVFLKAASDAAFDGAGDSPHLVLAGILRTGWHVRWRLFLRIRLRSDFSGFGVFGVLNGLRKRLPVLRIAFSDWR